MPLSSKKLKSNAVAPITAKFAPPTTFFFFIPKYGFSSGSPSDSAAQYKNCNNLKHITCTYTKMIYR